MQASAAGLQSRPRAPLSPARQPGSTCARAQVPHTLASGSWETAEAPYVRHLLSICDRFAPGTSDLARAAPRPRRAPLPSLPPHTAMQPSRPFSPW